MRPERDQQAKNARLAAWLALPVFLYGAADLMSYWRFVSRALTVQGTVLVAGTRQMVIGYEVGDSSYEIRVAQPRLRGFSTVLDVGDDVRVLYESSNPAKARWHSARNWQFPTLLIGVSLLGIGPMICRLVAWRRRP